LPFNVHLVYRKSLYNLDSILKESSSLLVRASTHFWRAKIMFTPPL